MMHPTRAAPLSLVEKWLEFLRISKNSHAEPQPEMLPSKGRQFSHPTENGPAFRADVIRDRQAAPDSALRFALAAAVSIVSSTGRMRGLPPTRR
jgi:hypothetical protein